MKKAITLIILCIFVIGVLSSCTLGHIKDENGKADTSLAKLTDEDILAKVPSYTQVAAVKNNFNNKIEYEAEKFSGVTVLENIPYAVGERLIIKSDIELEKGNLRVVLIQSGVIIKDIPKGEDQTTIIEESRRDYELRLAGESAEFELEIEYEIVEYDTTLGGN